MSNILLLEDDLSLINGLSFAFKKQGFELNIARTLKEADEFTSDEKTEFLIEVENNERLKEEFIENQTLLALVDWISPEYENNKEVVQHKLYEFMRRMEQHKDK